MAPKAVYRGTRNDWLLADVQCQHVAVRARDDVFPCVIEPRGDAVAWLMAEHDQVDLQRFGELLDLRCDRTRCGMDVLVRDCASAAKGSAEERRGGEARGCQGRSGGAQ